jgi:hypothetical protein
VAPRSRAPAPATPWLLRTPPIPCAAGVSCESRRGVLHCKTPVANPLCGFATHPPPIRRADPLRVGPARRADPRGAGPVWRADPRVPIPSGEQAPGGPVSPEGRPPTAGRLRRVDSGHRSAPQSADPVWRAGPGSAGLAGGQTPYGGQAPECRPVWGLPSASRAGPPARGPRFLRPSTLPATICLQLFRPPLHPPSLPKKHQHKHIRLHPLRRPRAKEYRRPASRLWAIRVIRPPCFASAPSFLPVSAAV